MYKLETQEMIRRVGEPLRSRPCPNCGRPMHLLRSAPPPQGVLPDMRRYRCGECGVSVTEAVDD